MALTTGTQLGRYEIRTKIGAGGMGALGIKAFDATFDGRRFLIAIAAQAATFEPITVVLNWTADLKR